MKAEFLKKCEWLGVDPISFEMEQVASINASLEGFDLDEDGNVRDQVSYYTWLIARLDEVSR